jgi:hypothetical protein
VFEVALATRGQGAAMDVIGGGVIRTARKIMDGQVFVPAKAFSGEERPPSPCPSATTVGERTR